MLKIEIPDEDLRSLQELRDHPHPMIRRKAMTLILKGERIPHKQIATIVGISPNTMRNYLKGYKEKGIDFVKAINPYRPMGKLISFEQVIKEYLDKTPPSSASQASCEIEKLTGVKLSKSQTRAYLKLFGAGFRKVSGIPAKADVEKQKKFKEEFLDPRLEEAKAGTRLLYFVDAAHFVLGAFLGYLWSLSRVFVRTPSGRQRFNVLGALNPITKELITFTNDTYITSIQVCELLKNIAKDAIIPITLVLDNAKYQRCHLVMNLAEQLGIELLFLPPYSPNLNLIERLWKFIKKNCLNSMYYSNFDSFRQAICTLMHTMNETHQDELDSLLTLNFQMFKEEDIKSAI